MNYKTLSLSILIILNSFPAFTQKNSTINNAFKELKDGYIKRDTSFAEKFTDDLCTMDIQILGTGENEIINGAAAAKNLFINDWLHWFSVLINTDSTSLSVSANNAYFITAAIASISFTDKETAYDFALRRLKELTDREKTNRNKLLSYSEQSSDMIQQIESGSLDIKYHLRLSGALVRQNGKWLFKQLIFSFPYPMERK